MWRAVGLRLSVVRGVESKMRTQTKALLFGTMGVLVAALGVFAWQCLRPHTPTPVFKGKPVTFWVRSLGDGSMDTFDAQRSWASFGPDAVPYLAKALVLRNSPADKVYIVLWPHLPAIVRKRLRRPVVALSVRQNAASVLSFWSEGRRLAVPALVSALKDEDWTVRQNVAGALYSVGKEHPEVVPALMSMLHDEHAEVRRNAASSLGCFGPSANGAIPALLRALQDPDALVRVASAHALILIEPATAAKAGVLPLLLNSLTNTNRYVRANAALTLSDTRNESGTVVLALAESLEHDADPFIRHTAAEALYRVGTPAQAAVPALLAALSDENADVRKWAARALTKIDPKAAANAGVK